jgi:hypothetical protein
VSTLPVSKLAVTISENLRWWREEGQKLVLTDRALADSVQRPAGDEEWTPNDEEIAKLRAIREQTRTVPDHPGFVPQHTAAAPDVMEAERGMATSGQVYPLGDADEGTGLFERDSETVAVSDADFENIRTRESSYVWTCKNRAGEIVRGEQKAKADAGQAELQKNTMDMALALASGGVPAFMPATSPRFSIVCPELEKRIDVAPVRRVNFLPSVAKARRDPLVKHLEAFCSRQTAMYRCALVKRRLVTRKAGYVLPAESSSKWEYAGTRDANCRMATFTAGRLLPVIGKGELVRERTQFLHRRLSALNKHPLFRSHGATMHFRATEYGTIRMASPWPRQPGTEEGVPYVHLHAHVVYSLEHKLAPRRWRRFLSKVKNLWRYHWDESGKLENVREACKYPIKPGDTGHLENKHIVAFYHATRGLHLVQPLGELREIIGERRDAGLKLVRLRNAAMELELKPKPDWNASVNRLTRAEKSARAAYREQEKRRWLGAFIKAARLVNARDAVMLAAAYAARSGTTTAGAVVAALMAQAVRLDRLAAMYVRLNPRPVERLACPWPRVAGTENGVPYVEQRFASLSRPGSRPEVKPPPRPMVNRIFARLAPALYFDEITRPALFVANFNGDYESLRKEGFVKEYLDAVRPKIRAAEAQLHTLSVHTSHTTGGENTGGLIPALMQSEAWERPPDPEPRRKAEEFAL